MIVIVYDLQKYIFTNRMVNIWNSLYQTVVPVNNID